MVDIEMFNVTPFCFLLIPFLNDRFSLTSNVFVVAQFIAPLTFTIIMNLLMRLYFLELVLFSIIIVIEIERGMK